jgi:hypothetical protein
LASRQISEERRKLDLPTLRLKMEKSLLDGSRILHDDLFNTFPSNHQFYNHEIFQIIENNGPVSSFRMLVNDYMVTMDHLAGVPTPQAMDVLDFPDKQLKIATHNLEQWVGRCLRNISQMRNELR